MKCKAQIFCQNKKKEKIKTNKKRKKKNIFLRLGNKKCEGG